MTYTDMQIVRLFTSQQVLHMGETFSIPSIIEQLCITADHLLTHHDCDCHGWEGRLYAAQEGWKWLHKYGFTDIPELPKVPMTEFPKRRYEQKIQTLETECNRLTDLLEKHGIEP